MKNWIDSSSYALFHNNEIVFIHYCVTKLKCFKSIDWFEWKISSINWIILGNFMDKINTRSETSGINTYTRFFNKNATKINRQEEQTQPYFFPFSWHFIVKSNTYQQRVICFIVSDNLQKIAVDISTYSWVGKFHCAWINHASVILCNNSFRVSN